MRMSLRPAVAGLSPAGHLHVERPLIQLAIVRSGRILLKNSMTATNFEASEKPTS